MQVIGDKRRKAFETPDKRDNLDPDEPFGVSSRESRNETLDNRDKLDCDEPPRVSSRKEPHDS
jgi:hypothetical protein